MSLAILCSEQSGDQLGAGILRTMKRPAFGMGGPLLKEAGLEMIASPTHVMGITDVIAVLPRLLSTFFSLKKKLLERNPERIITIDSPDFFLPLHRHLRKSGYKGKLIHIVSPSVWAWRKKRADQMAKHLDLLIALFPFEAEHYAHTNLRVETIVHPLAYDILGKTYPPLTTPRPKPVLALFPGSRAGEIARNLPIQLEAAKHFPSHQVICSLARESLRSLFPSNLPTILADKRHSLMGQADLAIATSGTICFELALHGVPTVATYTLTPLNYFLGHTCFKIHLPHYTLPNLIMQKEMIPEHFEKVPQPKEIASSLQKLIDQKELYQKLHATFLSNFNLKTSPYEEAAALSMS